MRSSDSLCRQEPLTFQCSCPANQPLILSELLPVGAALAAAKLYTAEELTKAAEGKLDLIDRIRQKLVLAEKHRRKTRYDDNYLIDLESFSPVTKKPRSSAGKKKQGAAAKEPAP